MKDVFGQVLWSYWKGDHSTPHFICRDDGYLDETPTDDYFRTTLSPLEKLIAKYAKGKVLDVGSGAGRALLYFQKKGFDIHGIDVSPLAVKICRDRGGIAELKSIFQIRGGSFETALLFGNNIGIGGDLKGVEKLLKKLSGLVKKDGRLLLTSLDVSKTKNPEHLVYHQKNLKKGRYKGEVKIRVEYKGKKSGWFKWIHVAAEDLKKLASKSGWSLCHLTVRKDGSYGAVFKNISKSLQGKR